MWPKPWRNAKLKADGYVKLTNKDFGMEKHDAEPDEKETDVKKQADDNLFDTEEILIEELAVDGICGVY